MATPPTFSLVSKDAVETPPHDLASTAIVSRGLVRAGASAEELRDIIAALDLESRQHMPASLPEWTPGYTPDRNRIPFTLSPLAQATYELLCFYSHDQNLVPQIHAIASRLGEVDQTHVMISLVHDLMHLPKSGDLFRARFDALRLLMHNTAFGSESLRDLFQLTCCTLSPTSSESAISAPDHGSVKVDSTPLADLLLRFEMPILLTRLVCDAIPETLVNFRAENFECDRRMRGWRFDVLAMDVESDLANYSSLFMDLDPDQLGQEHHFPGLVIRHVEELCQAIADPTNQDIRSVWPACIAAKFATVGWHLSFFQKSTKRLMAALSPQEKINLAHTMLDGLLSPKYPQERAVYNQIGALQWLTSSPEVNGFDEDTKVTAAFIAHRVLLKTATKAGNVIVSCSAQNQVLRAHSWLLTHDMARPDFPHEAAERILGSAQLPAAVRSHLEGLLGEKGERVVEFPGTAALQCG